MLPELLLAALTSPCDASTMVPTIGHPIVIPADDRNDNFFAKPIAASGKPLTFYTDSGGGGPFMFSDTAAALGLTGASAKLTFACNAWIPLENAISIAPASIRLPDSGDGVLGGPWFDGHTWTWDYPGHQLFWRAQGDAPNVAPTHVVPLEFQRKDGSHTTGFPRIDATIAGETFSWLLDTGARTDATPDARKAAAFPVGPFAVSFVSKSIAERWHAAHPDWTYLPGAEVATQLTMIQVPEVTVGGYTVGPAWFVERPDKNFATFMSQYMDAPVIGALGGSVLRNFRLTVDYPGERAYFERP